MAREPVGSGLTSGAIREVEIHSGTRRRPRASKRWRGRGLGARCSRVPVSSLEASLRGKCAPDVGPGRPTPGHLSHRSGDTFALNLSANPYSRLTALGSRGRPTGDWDFRPRTGTGADVPPQVNRAGLPALWVIFQPKKEQTVVTHSSLDDAQRTEVGKAAGPRRPLYSIFEKTQSPHRNDRSAVREAAGVATEAPGVLASLGPAGEPCGFSRRAH